MDYGARIWHRSKDDKGSATMTQLTKITTMQCLANKSDNWMSQNDPNICDRNLKQVYIQQNFGYSKIAMKL